ncbi:MAG: hypothetical protein AB7I27_05730 [Bacteriovoracaceae bacterium]
MPILLGMMWLSTVYATVTVGAMDCPSQFRGEVKEVIDSLGPSTSLSTQKIVFKNHQTLKGDVDEQVVIEILENGPFKMEPGEEYEVKLRKGKPCWIEKI